MQRIILKIDQSVKGLKAMKKRNLDLCFRCLDADQVLSLDDAIKELRIMKSAGFTEVEWLSSFPIKFRSGER